MADRKDKSFLGTGTAYPVSIDPTTGRFKLSSYEDSVRESIYIILMTQQMERIARPDFGSNIMNYVFMDVNVTNISIMEDDLRRQIVSQEPRISDVSISTEYQELEGRLIISISYVVTETNTKDNLVFPFYLNTDNNEVPEESDDLGIEYEPEDDNE